METEALIVRYIDSLSKTMRQSMQKYKQEAVSTDLFNLTITQLHYLHAISELENPTFGQLAEKFTVQKSTVTDIVGRLIKRDIVYKQQSAEDLRVFHLYLTDKGKELLAIENDGYYQFAQKMTKCLDEQQKQQFTELLQIIVCEVEN